MIYRLPDVSEIGRVIGYRPAKSLLEILDNVIEYHSSRLQAEVPSA